MIDSSLPPPGAVLDAGLINESAHSSLPQALYSMRDLPLCEALLGRCGIRPRVFTLERSRGDAFGCTQLCSAACTVSAALAFHAVHTARTPLDSAAPGAGAAGAWPVAASRLRDSQAVGAPDLRAVETAASYG